MVRALFPGDEINGARQHVKLILLPSDVQHSGIADDIPDFLVTDSMVHRFLEAEPPPFMVIPEYEQVIREIEQAYVIGLFFSALAASCVAIERTLNLVRVKLHRHHKPIKALWEKGATNDWVENIDALEAWGYLDDALAEELRAIYRDIRCSYLHSGTRYDFSADAIRCVRAAYRLMGIFLGFPNDLFDVDQGRFACKKPDDPRFLEFYKPSMEEVGDGEDESSTP